MYAPCALALKKLAATVKTLCKLRVSGSAGDDVVQQLLRGAAGLVHQAHIGCAVAALERVAHEGDSLVLVEEVHCAAYRAVRRVPALAAEFLRIDVAKDALVEEVCDVHHVGGDARVGGVKSGVAAAGVCEAEGESHGAEISLYRLDLVRVKIDIYGVPKRAGQLIHESAGLAEILVLGLLCRAGDDHGVDLAIVEQLAQNLADEHSVCRGRTQTRTRRQCRPDLGIEAAAVQTKLAEGRDHAADEGFRRAEFAGTHGGVVQPDRKITVTLGVDVNRVFAVFLEIGVQAEVNGGGQNPALLVIRVVAGKLSPAGNEQVLFHIFVTFHQKKD